MDLRASGELTRRGGGGEPGDALGRRFRALVAEGTRDLFALDAEQLEALERHYVLLRRWNERLNLTSVHSVEELAMLHYCESVLLAWLLPQGELLVGDVGSGAGFPGYVMAVVRPELKITLIESDQRKAVFLREASRGRRNVKVIAERAERVNERFDWIVARGIRWQAVIDLLPRLAGGVGLLVGAEGFREILECGAVEWREPVAIPWRRQGYGLVGTVRAAAGA